MKLVNLTQRTLRLYDSEGVVVLAELHFDAADSWSYAPRFDVAYAANMPGNTFGSMPA